MGRETGTPICFPSDQLFEIHGSKLKPHPFGDQGQASVKCIAHAVLFFGVGKDALNDFLAFGIKIFVFRGVLGVVGQLLFREPGRTVLIIEGLFPWASRSALISASSSSRYRFAVAGTFCLIFLFRFALALIWVPSINTAAGDSVSAVPASFSTHWNTHSIVFSVNRWRKLQLTVEKCGSPSFSVYSKNQRYAMSVCALRSAPRSDGIPSGCYSSTVLTSTAGSTLGRPSSLLYSGSTISYSLLKSTALSTFRNRCSCGTRLSVSNQFHHALLHFPLFHHFYNPPFCERYRRGYETQVLSLVIVIWYTNHGGEFGTLHKPWR